MSVVPTGLGRGSSWTVAGAFAACSALTLIHLWPLARRAATDLTPNADTVLDAWWVSQMARQMVTDPLHLFEGNVYYPHPHTLAVVDHMLASSALAIPLWLATKNPILIHNVMLLGTFVLSGAFTALLVRRLCGSLLAGIAAGSAFAFCAFRWYELPHLHVLATGWMPLALIALDRLIDRPSRGRVAAFAGAALAVALSSWHAALVGGALIGTVALYSLAQTRERLGPRIARLCGVAMLVAIVVAPIAIPYTRLADWRLRHTAEERMRTLIRLSVSFDEFLPRHMTLGPPPENAHGNARASWAFPGIVTWVLAAAAFLPEGRAGGRIRWPRSLRIAGALALGWLGLVALTTALAITGRDGPLRALAPLGPVPVAAAALAVFALLAARHQARLADDDQGAARLRRARLTYAAVAGTGLLMALGPRANAWSVILGSGLFRPDWLPVLSVIRSPQRFGLLFAFGLAVLAGLGARRLAALAPARAAGAAMVAMLIVLNLDLRAAPINLRPLDPPSDGHRWLAAFREPGAVMELPGRHWRSALLGAFVHDRRIVNGVGYVHPPRYTEMWGLPEFSQERLDLLWERFHPTFMLINARHYGRRALGEVLASAEARSDAVTLVARAGNDAIFRLKDRGRGSVLRRIWPRRMLADAHGLLVSAAVTGAPGGRTDRLAISLNDRPILDVDGPASREGAQRRVPYEADWLVPGENRFEFLADYRYRSDEPRQAIGQTGMALAADVQVVADDRESWYQVNGDRRGVPVGYSLVVLDAASGRVLARASFNTARRAEDSDALARFVEGIAPATPVLVVSEGDASARLTEEGVAALRALGLTEDLRGRRGQVHAAVGVRNAVQGSALERTHRTRAELTLGAPRQITVQLDGIALY